MPAAKGDEAIADVALGEATEARAAGDLRSAEEALGRQSRTMRSGPALIKSMLGWQDGSAAPRAEHG
jgi:hypothetical protein